MYALMKHFITYAQLDSKPRRLPQTGKNNRQIGPGHVTTPVISKRAKRRKIYRPWGDSYEATGDHTAK